jgi:RimJ/RimL family protein N-acetyltransferase
MSQISFAPLEPDAASFLTTRTGVDYSWVDFSKPSWFCVTAREGDEILGVFVGEFLTWFEVQIACSIDHPRFLTRRLLRAIFTTLFSQAVRLTAFVRPDNEAGIKIMRHLGFQQEGYVRLAVEGRWDAMLFGMVRDECRYLEEPDHGQRSEAA